MKKIYLLVALFYSFTIGAQTTHTINAGSYYYNPAMLTIDVGDSVIWINDGGFHDVNGNISSVTGQSYNNPVSFNSSATNAVGAVIFSYQFTVPGVYTYDCSIGSHAANGMVGIVNVLSNSQMVGTWKLSPSQGALAVGPSQGSGGWWTSSMADATTRACLFDDSIKFDANGTMNHYMDGSTWLETWQGVTAEQCGSPLAPHDGSNAAAWSYSGNQLTVAGLGAHLGLPKAYNGGEINDPNNAVSSIVYEITMGSNGHSFTADIQSAGGGTGWWRFEYVKTQAPPPPSFSVTLKVNTANITVGPNGMYAGGGVLGDAVAVPLSDPDGDGVWEGVASGVPAAGGNYVFLNSPSNGGDWGTKEDLTGLPCGDAANWNDRLLPPITADTTIEACFGNCFDLTCSGVAPSTYDVTLKVNTANIIVGPNGMYAGGGVLGDAVAIPLADPDADGIWEGIATGVPAMGGNFVFLNSPSNGGDWGAKEDLTGLPCADPNNWNDRIMPALGSDTTILACFGNCISDGTCSTPTLVTYNVDINDYLAGGNVLAANGIRIAGNFATNGALSSGNSMPDWSPTDPSSAMSDPDGDNIWTITVSYSNLPTGTQQFYKFVNGDWGADESVNDTLCGGAGGFGSDRFLVIPSIDSSLCYKWATCSPCSNQPAVNSLSLIGIMDFTIPSAMASISGGAQGKAIHVIANSSISDLSVFGIGVANNGGGTDGQEYTFPSMSVSAGEHIIVARDTVAMSTYFDSCFSFFDHVLVASSSISQNGDDAIELFENGIVIETFGDINVDGTGQPWEYLDSWAFKDNNGNWTYGGVNCTDGSTSSQTSNCPYPICATVPPPLTYNVTLSVNTANISVGPNGMYAGGGMLGDAQAVPLSDPDGDGTWTGVASIIAGTVGNYIFLNSPAHGGDWGAKENLAGLPCSDPANFDDRILPIIYSDTTLLHCFGSCETDGTCPPPPAFTNVTFQVDMNQSGYPNGVPYLRGDWNWGASGDIMSDSNGDNIWQVVRPFTATTHEYIFAVDTNFSGSYDINEANDPNAPCTNGNTQYTNRVLIVPVNDSILGPVCLGSCDPCQTTPTTNDLIFQGIMSFDLPSSAGKAIHFKATQSISDLSQYGMGSANNGGGSDGEEFTFSSVSVNPGDDILLCRDSLIMFAYLESDCYNGFSLVVQAGEPTGNGDDAYELFYNGNVIETFGDIDVDGTGEAWEYTNSWAYKDAAGAWTYGGVNCTDSSLTTASSNCPYPFCGTNPPTNLSHNNLVNNIRIYPNPSSSLININSFDVISSVVIYDLLGKRVFNDSPNQKEFSIDISSFNSDIYIVEFTYLNGGNLFSKIIKD